VRLINSLGEKGIFYVRLISFDVPAFEFVSVYVYSYVIFATCLIKFPLRVKFATFANC
jgi:hypothetical protein